MDALCPGMGDQGAGITGRPAAIQASKPPTTSVALVNPRSCSAAAARLEQPCWQMTITWQVWSVTSGMWVGAAGSRRHSRWLRSMGHGPRRYPPARRCLVAGVDEEGAGFHGPCRGLRVPGGQGGRSPIEQIVDGAHCASRPESGAPGRTRTADFLVRSEALYPLSYGGASAARVRSARQLEQTKATSLSRHESPSLSGSRPGPMGPSAGACARRGPDPAGSVEDQLQPPSRVEARAGAGWATMSSESFAEISPRRTRASVRWGRKGRSSATRPGGASPRVHGRVHLSQRYAAVNARALGGAREGNTPGEVQSNGQTQRRSAAARMAEPTSCLTCFPRR